MRAGYSKLSNIQDEKAPPLRSFSLLVHSWRPKRIRHFDEKIPFLSKILLAFNFDYYVCFHLEYDKIRV